MEDNDKDGDDVVFVRVECGTLPPSKNDKLSLRIFDAEAKTRARKLVEKASALSLMNKSLNDSQDFKEVPKLKNSRLKLKSAASSRDKTSAIKVKPLDSYVTNTSSVHRLPTRTEFKDTKMETENEHPDHHKNKVPAASPSKLSEIRFDANENTTDAEGAVMKTCILCGQSVEKSTFAEHRQRCMKGHFSKTTETGTTSAISERIKCPICKKDLSHMNYQRQTQHTNHCLNQVESDEETSKKFEQQLLLARNAVLPCPLCRKKFKTKTGRQAHLKKCATFSNMTVDQVKTILRQQEEEHNSKLDAGILPEELHSKLKKKSDNQSKPRKPKNQEDEETQLAMALSKSLAEDEAQLELDVLESLAMVAPTAAAQHQVQGHNSKGKGKKNKKEETESLLLSLSKEEAMERISHRVDKYIFSCVQPRLTANTPPFSRVDKPVDGPPVENIFWPKASLDAGAPALCGREEFYVRELMPLVSVSTVEAGSKLKRLSVIPGRRRSVDQSPEEGHRIEAPGETQASQTVEILAELALESDLHYQGSQADASQANDLGTDVDMGQLNDLDAQDVDMGQLNDLGTDVDMGQLNDLDAQDIRAELNDQTTQAGTGQLSNPTPQTGLSVLVPTAPGVTGVIQPEASTISGLYTHSPNKKDPAVPSSLEDCLAAMVSCPLYSDLSITDQDGGKIPAHKVIVHARCPQLLSLADGDVIDLSNYNHHSIICVLTYIYSSQIVLPHPYLSDVVRLANKFNLKELAVAAMGSIIVTDLPQPSRGERSEVKQEMTLGELLPQASHQTSTVVASTSAKDNQKDTSTSAKDNQKDASTSAKDNQKDARTSGKDSPTALELTKKKLFNTVIHGTDPVADVEATTVQMEDSTADQVTDSTTVQMEDNTADLLEDSRADHVTDNTDGHIIDSRADHVTDSTATHMDDSRAVHMKDSTAVHMEAIHVEEVIPEASLPRFYVVAHEARPNPSATCMSSTDQSSLLAVVKEENGDLPSGNDSVILFEFEPCKKEELNEDEFLEYPTALGQAAAQFTLTAAECLATSVGQDQTSTLDAPDCLATSVGQGQTSALDAPECLATSATGGQVLPSSEPAADGSSTDASQSSNIGGQATVSSVVPSCFRSVARHEGFTHLGELASFRNVETHKGPITLTACHEAPQCQLISDHPPHQETSVSSSANTSPPTSSSPGPPPAQATSVNCLALISAVNTSPPTASLGPPPAQPELSNKEPINAAAKGRENAMVAPAVLKRKRKKKVTKKDFKSIVDKVVCQLPYMSVSGESQYLSQLLSDEDFEKIAIKVEQDFYTGPNDSVFIPFILDTDEASSDVEITFSNIKEPRFKKRRTRTKEKAQKRDQSSSDKTPEPVKQMTATHQAQVPPSLLTNTKPQHPSVDIRLLTSTTEKLTHPPNTHPVLASTSIPRHIVSLLKESIRKKDVLINLPSQQHSPTPPSPILPETQRGARPAPHVSSMSSLLATRSSTPLNAHPCTHPASTSLAHHSPVLTPTTKKLSEDYVSGEELFSDEDNGGSTKQLSVPTQKFQNCMSPSNSNWILLTQPISSSPRKLLRLNQVLKSPEPQQKTLAPYQSPALTEQNKTEKKTVSHYPRVPSTKGQVESACSTSFVSHTVPAASASHTGACNSSLDASSTATASHSACNSPANVVDVIADLLVQHLKPKARLYKVSSDIQTIKANTSGQLGAQRTSPARVNASSSPGPAKLMNDTHSSDSSHLSMRDSDGPTCRPARAGNKLSPHTSLTNKKTKKVDKDGRKKKDPLKIKLPFLSRSNQLNKTSSLDKTLPLVKTPPLDKTSSLDTFNSSNRTNKMSPLASDLSVKMIKTTSPLVSNPSVKGTKKTPVTQSTVGKTSSNLKERQAHQKFVPELSQPSSKTLHRCESEPATFNPNKKHMSATTGQSPNSCTKVANGQSLTSYTKVANGQSFNSYIKVANDLHVPPTSPSKVNGSSVKTTKASHTTSNTSLETSEHLQDFRSPKKTIRGLASKKSPILLSSTWVDKSHVDVGESWISSPVNKSTGSPHNTQPTVATNLRGAALDSPDLVLLDSPDLVLLETSKFLHQSSNSSSSKTSSCKKILFSTSNSLNRNSSNCKGMRSTSPEETLPSPKKLEESCNKVPSTKSNVILDLGHCTSQTDECKRTETFTKVPAKAVIIAESPLPLRQRLGLTNPFINNIPGQCQQAKQQTEILKQAKQQTEGLKQVKQQTEGLKQVKQPTEGLKQVKQPTEGLKQVKQPTEGLKQQTEGLKQVKQPTEGLKQGTKALKQVQAPTTSVSDQPTEEVSDELDTTFDDICLQEIEAMEQQYQQTVQPSRIPCAKTPAQHKNLKKVNKKKTSKAPSPFTPMAPYDEMATPELKKAVSKIGVRPVCKKRMRDLLKQVYHATHQYETDSEYEGTPVKCMRTNVGPSRLQLDVPQKSKPKTTVPKNQQKARTGSVQVNCLPETHSVADGGLPRAGVHNSSSSEREVGRSQDDEDRGSQDSSYSDSPDLPEESILQGWPDEEIGSTQLTQTSSEVTQERLVQFVMENKDVYEKVLMYEPLELDVLKKRIAEAGIRTSMEKVMDFLDERCITFTMKNINKGHNRHQRKQKSKSSKSPKKTKSSTNKE